ncbi:MAG: hypothetical protein J4F46_03475 [Dehalococcoidia bacterium]|nr:hypothetical protein [Dehalococcoidia bacterium]
MCTWIVEKADISGSAKGPNGWFPVTRANVCYDHPSHAFLEHSLNIDFVNEELGTGARVAVEMSAESARSLVRAILAALETGDGQHQPGYSLSGASAD